MVFQWLAVAVAWVHAGYLIYLVVGGYLAWRFPKTFFVHAVASFWALVIVLAGMVCPLTVLQNALRVRGGQPELPGAYLDVYVRDVIYPVEYQTQVYWAVALLIAVSWLGLAVRRYRGRRTTVIARSR